MIGFGEGKTFHKLQQNVCVKYKRLAWSFKWTLSEIEVFFVPNIIDSLQEIIPIECAEGGNINDRFLELI